MNYVELVLRLAVASAAGLAVAAALPASRAGSRPARLVVAGATGAACLELLAALNVPIASPLLWTFTRVTAPLAWLVLLAGLVPMLRGAPAASSAVPDPTPAAPAVSPPKAPRPGSPPLIAPTFLRSGR